jgi:hypothetical protein
MKGGAFEQTHNGKEDAAKSTVRAQRVYGVMRASGGEAAAAGGAEENRERGRERALIDADEQNQAGGWEAGEAD